MTVNVQVTAPLPASANSASWSFSTERSSLRRASRICVAFLPRVKDR